MIIVLEGIDACGKATQAKLLLEHLSKTHDTNLFSFPRYDTPVGHAIKRHLIGQTQLVSKSSGEVLASDDAMAFQGLQMLDKCSAVPAIRQLSSQGGYVILDRWWPSSWVYGRDDGVPIELLSNSTRCLPDGDLNILLDINEDEAARRRPIPRDRYEQDREKLQRMVWEYRRMWNSSENMRSNWKVIDGSLPVDQVLKRILGYVNQ